MLLDNTKHQTRLFIPQITGTPFLHAYYQIFSQRFIDDSTNFIAFVQKQMPI